MGVTKERTVLYCIHCQKETLHTLTYVGGELQKIKCTECGMEISFDKKQMLLVYSEDLVKRILTKPKRMSKEAFSDLSSFLKSLPLRIATKPARIVREVKDLLDD